VVFVYPRLSIRKSNDFSFSFFFVISLPLFASLREIKEFFSRKVAKDAKEEK